MSPRGGLRPTHVALLKRLFTLAVLAALAYGGYRFYMGRRPALPGRGADYVAYDYLVALRSQDYNTAYSLATTSAQAATNPQKMADTCRETYASIDDWTIQPPKYAPTHLSASVPVTLVYRAAWAPDDQQRLNGQLDFDLDKGNWRLRVAVPFISAVRQQRPQQHIGGK